MVLTDSHGISRAPCYLGYPPPQNTHVDYETGTLSGPAFKRVRLYASIRSETRQNLQVGPTTPHVQRLPALTHARFSLIRVRSPLLTESLLFSLPVGTEMFHFPTFPLPALYIQAGVTGMRKHTQRGFPIRKSSDHSPLIGSPRLIADCYVLLRLQMPRHPPSALKDLKSHEPQKQKIDLCSLSLRCSRPLCSSQSTTTPTKPTHTTVRISPHGVTKPPTQRLILQDPTTCTHPTQETTSFPPQPKPQRTKRNPPHEVPYQMFHP